MDYNKANLRWAHRIAQENRFSTSRGTSSFEIHRNSKAIQDKVGNLPPPRDQMSKVLDYIKGNEGSDLKSDGLGLSKSSPQEKFLIPQVRHITKSMSIYRFPRTTSDGLKASNHLANPEYSKSVKTPSPF